MMPRDEALRESMELYRRRAKGYRVAAEGVSGECLRVALLEMAKSYDLLVTATELKLADTPAGEHKLGKVGKSSVFERRQLEMRDSQETPEPVAK